MKTNNINYSAVRTTSNIDGTIIQEILDLYDSKSPVYKFGNQRSISQDGLAIFVDCQCPMSWEKRCLLEPRLTEFTFSDIDRPSYLESNCQNTTESEASIIISTKGELGSSWLTNHKDV